MYDDKCNCWKAKKQIIIRLNKNTGVLPIFLFKLVNYSWKDDLVIE